jgi:hypothetical protein
VPNNGLGTLLSQWKINTDSLFTNKVNVEVNGSNNVLKTSSSSALDSDNIWGSLSNQSNSGWSEKKENLSSNTKSVPLPHLEGDSIFNNDFTNTLNSTTNTYGIPEFQPGKPWKGPGMENPSEESSLIPGSVGSTLGIRTTQTDNSSSLTSPTWSFNNPLASEDKQKDPWSTDGGSCNASSILTPMGQDLWGKSNQKPSDLGGWPYSKSVSSNGWL